MKPETEKVFREAADRALDAIDESELGLIPSAVLEESALCQAQATISNAMRAAGITRRELARRMDTDKANITRMLSDGYSMTIRTFTRALIACGCEARFGFEPISHDVSSRGE